MDDIHSRLRNWRQLHLTKLGSLMDEAADEIDRLRDAIRRLAEQDATLSVVGGNVTVTVDATLTDEIARLRAERDTASHQAELNYQEEIERLRLTDAERTAIQRLREDYEGDGEPASAGVVATLRGLLERTK